MTILNKGNELIDNSKKSDSDLVNDVIMHSYNSEGWTYLLHNSPIAEIYYDDKSRYTHLESLVLNCDIIESRDTDDNGWGIRITPKGNIFLKQYESYLKYLEVQEEENKKLLAQSENLSSLEVEKLQLEVEKLRNDFFDYPATKLRIRRNEIFTIITIIIALIALTVSLVKK